MHNYVLKYWAVRANAVRALPEGFVDADLLKEHIAEMVAAAGEPAVGTITEPPAHPGWPLVVSEAFVYGPKDDRITAWNHYAISPDGTRSLLGKKPTLVGDHYCILDCEPTTAAALVPPQANIDAGHKCETCKRWAHKQGQDHLNQVTHQFDGGAKGYMWVDIAHMTAANHDVEIPDTLATFGLCLKHKRLTHSYFPGCDQYAAVSSWTPRAVPATAAASVMPETSFPGRASE
jgi:hypothetical protein